MLMKKKKREKGKITNIRDDKRNAPRESRDVETVGEFCDHC